MNYSKAEDEPDQNSGQVEDYKDLEIELLRSTREKFLVWSELPRDFSDD